MAKKYEHSLDKSWWFGKDDKKKNRVADSSTPTAEQFNRLMDMVEQQGDKITKMHRYLENHEKDITALQSLVNSLHRKHPDWWEDDQPGNEEAYSSPIPGSYDHFEENMDKIRRAWNRPETTQKSAASMAKWHDKQMKKIRKDMCSVPPPADDQGSESE